MVTLFNKRIRLFRPRSIWVRRRLLLPAHVEVRGQFTRLDELGSSPRLEQPAWRFRARADRNRRCAPEPACSQGANREWSC